MGREAAARVLDRYELAHAGEQRFETLSGGRPAGAPNPATRVVGATLLLLDEPTDNLDVQSAEALEAGLEAFNGSSSRSLRRWFARGFDRFLVYGASGEPCTNPTVRCGMKAAWCGLADKSQQTPEIESAATGTQ